MVVVLTLDPLPEVTLERAARNKDLITVTLGKGALGILRHIEAEVALTAGVVWSMTLKTAIGQESADVLVKRNAIVVAQSGMG